MTFRVGQKVVCVDDLKRVSQRPKGWFERFRKFTVLGHNLNAGDVYTVTGIGRVRDHLTQQDVETLFVGGAWHFGFPEIGFPSFQFRPAVERKTSIEIFTAMLNPSKQGIDA